MKRWEMEGRRVTSVDASPGGGFSRSPGAWFSSRGTAFTQAQTALGLSLPFLVLVFLRYTGGINLASPAGLYTLLAIVGYYGLALFLVLTLAFLVLAPWRRAALLVTGALLALAFFYFLVDATVYRIYRYHVDGFYLQLAIGSLTGIGLTPRMWVQAAVALLLSVGLVRLLYRGAARVRRRPLVVAGMLAALLLAFVASQVMHIMAYDRNDTRLTSLSPRLPFYYPVHSHRKAAEFAGLLPMIRETAMSTPGEAGAAGPRGSLAYPLQPPACVPERLPNIVLLLPESWRFDAMDSTVSPRIWRLARRSSVFRRHYSSGNSTSAGVFSLFYGLHPTYWNAVKANAASIDNPVLIDILRQNGYAFGIFADSHFKRHKIKDTVFRGIEVIEDFEGRTPDARDRDLTRRMWAFSAESHRAGRPFFAFAFYKSSHFSYHYPPESAPFQPAENLNMARGAPGVHRERVLNDYRNSVHYTDELIGDYLDRLEAAGILANTIVVITSEHGEEFDDDHAGYWGHTSNFTGYQVRVPLIVHVPWREPRMVDEVTMHLDLPPTLITEGLGCRQDAREYCNGVDLFGPIPADRPVVIGSYVNYAIVVDEDVFVVYPMFVKRYRLWDINGKVEGQPQERLREVLEETSRFFRVDRKGGR